MDASELAPNAMRPLKQAAAGSSFHCRPHREDRRDHLRFTTRSDPDQFSPPPQQLHLQQQGQLQAQHRQLQPPISPPMSAFSPPSGQSPARPLTVPAFDDGIPSIAKDSIFTSSRLSRSFFMVPSSVRRMNENRCGPADPPQSTGKQPVSSNAHYKRSRRDIMIVRTI